MPALPKTLLAAAALCAWLPALAATPNPLIPQGLGGYYARPHAGGLFSAGGSKPPQARFRTPAMMAQAAPTNQWFSSVMFTRWSFPLYAMPVSYRAVPAGFEIGVPTPATRSERDGFKEVSWAHRAQLTVEPAFKPDAALLAGHGDWSATVAMPGQGHTLQATIVRGSPFSYYEVDDTRVSLQLASPAQAAAAAADGSDEHFSVGTQAYGVYGPAGTRMHWDSPTRLVLELPAGKGWFSVAALPDTSAATLRQFREHAYAFVTDTRVHWRYDQANSQVVTDYDVHTRAMRDDQRVALTGLLPNLWQGQDIPGLGPLAFASVRGTVKLLAANHFSTRLTYHGIVPFWPGLPAADGGSRVDALLGGDTAAMPGAFAVQGNGTYWFGKGLGRAAQLMNIAYAQGQTDDAQRLQKTLEEHFEQFFSGRSSEDYFVVDPGIGSTLGYPSEYGSVSHMNDHHFHYGYWIHAAAQLALRDPQWARKDHWGGMVDLLVDDIATARHGQASYPFLRNFDPYEGHSWASGDATMEDGNNQESSSEAVNAWAGLIFWGAATGDTALRDLGIYLYTTEVHAIDAYWFDLHHQVFAPDYRRVLAAQVFGGKYAYNTWWTQNPREIQGINLLPITTASTYLGADPQYIAGFFQSMDAMSRRYADAGASDGTPDDIWQDVFAEYRAMAFPEQALHDWNSQGSTEGGDTRTHAYFTMRSLQRMGRPDFSVTADTPLYAVFRTPAGVVTHLAFNSGDQPLPVHFSDGAGGTVAAHSLAVFTGAAATSAAQR